MDNIQLLRKMPQVLRARGYRLYLQNGQRVIDLWLNGGKAILGHTPPNLLRELKNTASRGLYAPFPHFTEQHYLKALSKLLPGYSFRLYASMPPQELPAQIWRPFTDPPKNGGCYQLVLPIVPCVIAAQTEEQFASLPPSDLLSPILLATAARGVYDIIAASVTAPYRVTPHLPRTFKTLKESDCPWKRDGIYLTPKEKPAMEIWKTLFDKFLEAGFLLPPTPEHPVILPGELSDGEDAKLAKMLEKEKE